MEIKNFIWGICDDVLRGNFKRHQYGDIILPFVVLRRMDCVIKEHKDEIIKLYDEYNNQLNENQVFDIIHSKLKLKFSNISNFDLNRLKKEPTRLKENLYDYLKSFSPNVQDIINNFKLDDHIEQLIEDNSLFIFIEKFSEIDLHPSSVDNHTMGTIYEELLNKFSEMSNETSGEHYTPRDVVELLVSLVFTPHKDELLRSNKIIKVYDPCCGTGGMLTIGKEWIKKNINENIDIFMYGQENIPQTYSICKSDFLISDEEPDNIKLGNTLTKDCFSEIDIKFDYMICNPPYGVSWKKEKKEVVNESKDENGRFYEGLPPVTDGQLLFLQHMLSKMENTESGSRIGVVFNNSPLYTGDSGSGSSNIRKWIIENDWLETIIQLPNQLFFNTTITTFFWILTNRKSPERKGKIQLIDGSNYFKIMKKNLGKKRKTITPSLKQDILNEYTSFKESEYSKIFNNDFFGFKKIQVDLPLIINGNFQNLQTGNLKSDPSKRQFERVPLECSVDKYFEREVKPFLENSWIEKSNCKIGYQINFTKQFFKYQFQRTIKTITKDFKNVTINDTDQIFTKGLDVNSKLKDSGIEWIGSVPDSWEVKRLKFISEVIPSNVDKKIFTDELQVKLCNYTHVYYNNHISSNIEFDKGSCTKNEFDNFKLHKNDIIITKDSESPDDIGIPSYVSEDLQDIVCGYHLTIIRPISILGEYLFRFLQSDKTRRYFEVHSNGVTRFGISKYVIEDLYVPIPPISEQEKIIKEINLKINIINQTILKEEEKIKLLNEYKNTLITDVITNSNRLRE